MNQFRAASGVICTTTGFRLFEGLTTAEIVHKINAAMLSINSKLNDRPIEVRAAAVLRSGDVQIHTEARLMGNWLIEHKHEWAHLADKASVTSQIHHAILFNYVLVQTNVDSPEFIPDLCAQNDIDPKEVHAARWLNHPKDTGKTHGTIILYLYNKNLVSLLKRGGLYLDFNRLQSRKLDEAPLQCLKFLNLRQTTATFKDQMHCALCGEAHDSKSCVIYKKDQKCV